MPKKNSQIIMPGDEPAQTKSQKSSALSPHEMPECSANPGVPCRTVRSDFMVKGYDDKHRCKSCNDIHIELVMEEAGNSAPNSEPQFVSPKMDKRADRERDARINSLNSKLATGIVNESGQTKGSTGIPLDVVSASAVNDGDYRDMKDAMSRDEHGTRDKDIGDDERRKRIMEKYAKRTSGSKMG